MKNKFDIEQFHTVHKILICDKCNGKGFIKIKECTDYHKNDYEFHEEKCRHCEGSGRILEIHKWLILVEPYDPRKDASENIRFKLKNKNDKNR